MNIEFDPFAGIEDEADLSPDETRELLFNKAKLGYARIRKEFVQLDDYAETTKSRGSVLATFVTSKKSKALDLLLAIHALYIILDGSPLPLATWARLLSTDTKPCTTRTVSAALRTLRDMKLLEFSGPPSQPIITLKRENGSGDPLPPRKADEGRGFFTIPFEFWLDGHAGSLSLPAKAMLLIILKETQDPQGRLTFSMPVARAQSWYGISERSAERGYVELTKHHLIQQRVQKIADPQHPAGRREVVHRAPDGIYSTAHREHLRLVARSASETP